MSLLIYRSLRPSITRTIISRPTVLTTSLSAPTTTLTRAYASKKTKPKHQQKGGGSRHNNNSSNSSSTDADAGSEFPLSSSSSLHSSKRAPVSTASLTPGSQQALTDPAARDEYARADAKMVACVERFRREVAQLEARASGRVTPRLLDPVRVSGVAPLSPSESSSGSGLVAGAKKGRLEEVATVGVRDGSTLIVTVFDPHVSLLLVVACPTLPPSSRVSLLNVLVYMGCPLIGRERLLFSRI
jgi:hypothetical protein